jgi:hypothetical protein
MGGWIDSGKARVPGVNGQVDGVTIGKALFLVAVAGVLLLFSREWPVRLAGAVLAVPRKA